MNRNEARIEEIRRRPGNAAKSPLVAPRHRHENSRDGKEEAVSRYMFLPGFAIGAFPNHLNRSSLIAPIARNERKQHSKTKMVTRRDCFLEYSGEQLDEADGDLIMARRLQELSATRLLN
ncbi:hypothetical protein [Stutzerimonas stutzeri]|uniref:hypothetical protein n=1 Tax=Stutzerimonas stutzeri TaxID=316 RepID=UPI001EE400BE|nr:hypothetical protein [Stutzerimonas stutzeri]UWG60824.1 hypothetical protein NDR94_01340 [Stutzerimonas stutzeri]